MNKTLTVVLLAMVAMPGGAFGADAAADTRPYEIVWANRTHDDHEPILPMTDAVGWRVETENAVAHLESATDRRMFGPGVVRLIYRGTGPKPRVKILPQKPVRVANAFDAVSLWIYGNNVYYSAKTKDTPPTTLTAEFVDADGKPFSVKVAYISHLEWWLAQKRLADDLIPRAARGAMFTGFTLTGGTNATDKSLDFTSFCAFKEEFAPVSFKARPKRANRVFPDAPAGINTGDGTLPFPNRALTVVPPPSGETFQFRLPSDLAIWDDLAFSRDGGKTWQPFAKGGGLWFAPDDPKDRPFRAACPYVAVTNRVAPLDVTCRGTCAATGCRAEVRFHVEGQSLVADVHVDGGRVAEVRFGSWPEPEHPRLVRVPYYTYNGYGAARPFVLVTDTASGPIFHAATMDWTQSNASTPFSDPDLVEDALGANGGTRYIPRTDGVRNPCFERFVYSFGSRFADVLPVVPNDVSPWKHVTGSVVWRAHGASNRANDTAYWRKVRNRGMKHVLVTDHETGWRDGNESFTFRTNPAPKKGGDKGQYDYARTMIDEFGFWYGPYNNFTDFAPINGNWSADRVSRTADNQLQTAWNRCYAPKPAYAVNACEELTPIIQGKFHFNTAYCDVHTAVSPWGRCDYDARIPGGGTFANTFYAFGEIMLIQKKNWNGPVYSEGNTHFMYCGLTDGNYAQDQNYRISDNPWLVDFDLLRLHPLCCNFGMGNPGMFYPNKSAPTNNVVATDRLLAATVAFGHPGFLLHDPHMERSYFMVQQLAARYTMADAVEIRYVDAEGRAHETSDAVASDVFARSQVTVRYSDGTFVAANGSMDEAMRVTLPDGVTLWLPPNGYFGFTRDGKVLTYSGLIDGHRVDYAYSPEYVYLDARGAATTLAGISTNKVCVRLAEREDISHIALVAPSDLAKRSMPPAGMFKPKPASAATSPLPFIRRAGVCIRGQEEGPATPESKGHAIFGSQQTCGGVSRKGIVMHPPYGKGAGYAFASFRIDAGGPHVFHAFVGKGDGSDLGDGIYYKVCVQTPDGKRTVVAEETVRTHEWRPIRADLRPWSGTNVRLVLIADCGPKNNTCGDWAAWGDCRLASE